MSLEDLVKLIKGFVDILILASGYQSSGLLAHWDALNIKKAFQWGLFFENLFRHLSSSDDYKDSVRELDAALLEMTSNSLFPQGLNHLSSVMLTRAREFVLAHLLHTLPLQHTHLRALMTAAVDVDLDELRATESDSLHVYLNKLMLQDLSLNQVEYGRDFKSLTTSSSNIAPDTKFGSSMSDNFTKHTVQELLKRKSLVSCLSSANIGLDVLSKTITRSNLAESDNSLFDELTRNATASLSKEKMVEYVTWNCWRSRSLSYLLDKRTVRLVSGAGMIFSAPKIQWVQVFERMNIGAESNYDLHETIELLLLGCIASRWSSVLDYIMSVSYDSLTILNQYCKVRDLNVGRSESFHYEEGATDLKVSDILEYLRTLLGSQLYPLWKLSPVLVAVAIPSWSALFRMYLSEIEAQIKGNSPNNGCCTCTQYKKEHKDCALSERIWCLYIFHVCGSNVMRGSRSSCS